MLLNPRRPQPQPGYSQPPVSSSYPAQPMTSHLHQSSYNLPMPSQPDPTPHLGSPRIANSHSQARPIQEAPFMPTFRSKEEFDRYIRDLVQGAASQPFSIESMCHCLNVNLPHWYKIPKLQKFNGPQHHLRLFVNETLPVRDNKDNKIFLFQKSLVSILPQTRGNLIFR